MRFSEEGEREQSSIARSEEFRQTDEAATREVKI